MKLVINQHMGSMVLHLQRDAIDKNSDVDELVRKAFAISRKLKIRDFSAWCELELDGYQKNREALPAYRFLTGDLKALNPYNGLHIPIIFDEPDTRYTRRGIETPIGEIQTMVADSESGGTFVIGFNAEATAWMMRKWDIPRPPGTYVTTTQFAGILDAVRKVVLNWTLQLEEDGILGEDMKFSPEELQAATSPAVHIENFISSMNNSQFVSNSPHSNNTANLNVTSDQLREVVTKINAFLAAADLTAAQKAEVEAEAATIEVQASSPNPKRAILKEALGSVKKIAESCAGNLTARGVIEMISRIDI